MNTTENGQEALGIDLGNTIIKHREARPDALRVIARLVRERFGPRTHVVSRVNPEQEIRAKAWILRSDFHALTGVPVGNVHFCAERHEKGPICEELGITHFIDDRPEVMIYMPSAVTDRILFDPSPADLEQYQDEVRFMRIARTWNEVENMLLAGEPAVR